ncbi:spermatogenesis-associated protein 22 isoform X3 [Narcine bancroftii]|uniref:spermatogenesis-associated protein 22 isoform X3 n=1 Tax=Narcine bancroftii TaxID=1343680 RepID=UPI003831C11A
MKRNMTENSTRATAGYLPVLLFNQKKRARLPLTSNPMEHETGSNSIVPTPESFDSPPASNRGMVRSTPQNNQTIPNNYRAQFQYSNMRSNCGMAPVLNSAKSTKTSTGIKQQLGNTWKESNRPVIKERKEFASTTGTNRLQMKNIDTFRSHISSDSYKAQPKSYQQMPQMFKNSPQNVTVRRHCGQQNQFTENNFVNNPEDDVLKKSKPVQMKFTQPDNSLRVLTTTIEGMKHWTQYNDRFALLFEVFATLDSAVISGEYSAKNFLLRDRKESVPCVFYETDRDLPRLIRGQKHRCMGNYDRKRNLFKCVSVRPASTIEQKTYEEFVSVADAEMRQSVQALNEA